MSLPELDLQIVYGRLAWAVVLATVLYALWPAWRRSRAVLPGILAGAALMMALPGAASPAYWLGLAFQWPSGVLLGYCLAWLYARWQDRPRDICLPLGLALPLVLAGAVLYADAIGWTAQGVYYWGFGPYAAPALGLLIAFACAVALARVRARAAAFAVLFAMTLFALLRLPTGNLWDALLDPLLWMWALGSVAVVLGRRRRRGPAPLAAGAAGNDISKT